MKNRFIFGWVCAAFLSVLTASANERGGRWISFGLQAGNPSLLAATVGFVKIPWVEFGVHFGFAPINNAVRGMIRLSPVPVSVPSPDAYSFKPDANYVFKNVGGYLRILPFEDPWFLEVDGSFYDLGGILAVDLSNDTQGTVTSGAASGSIYLGVPALTVTLGRHFAVTQDFFLSAALGVVIPFAIQNAVSIGGTATQALPLIPGAEAGFEAAKTLIRDQMSSGLADVQKKAVVLLPSVQVGIGFWL